VAVALSLPSRDRLPSATVDSVIEFHDEDVRRNGYSRPDAPVEIVTLPARRRQAGALVLER
jgi:hypothetical protein